ncbi:hypothetical protein [Paenibacillus radicis (ex Gao et al. 2016)]|uniref:hypothetical protein n=1 Tax=Paenibacillus radicis (ex Gao et al. 2016) TaxID=1737354 RepID=UPI00166AD1D2|nr:hypothetical protein [Paenibacillus radicis (ex Gao et al. 2016)]
MVRWDTGKFGAQQLGCSPTAKLASLLAKVSSFGARRSAFCELASLFCEGKFAALEAAAWLLAYSEAGFAIREPRFSVSEI